MTYTVEAIQKHYESVEGGGDILSQVQAVLNTLPTGVLKPEQLAGLDQFHVRGLPATIDLAEMAELCSTSNVLDAGSGFGGSSRYLAKRFGCKVTGVDLTPSYITISDLLTERTGLKHLVSFQVGDVTELAFRGGEFDLVWTQHVVMNIRHRDKLYAEFSRVLRPGGRLVFYDVVAADDKPEIYFPVPWSDSESTSFLMTKEETVKALENAGLPVNIWNDVTESTMKWFAQQQPQSSAGPTLASIMGPRFAGRLANLGRNFREGRAHLIMGRATRRA
jgi:ubiquinone/menaquinone biosynthesis C-methylase UbiE